MGKTVLIGPLLALLAGAAVPAQDLAANASQRDRDTIRAGLSFYEARCSDCHGVDAKGVLGPDLTGLWAAGASDERVFRTIRNGVPGSEMPASTAPDSEIQATIAYLRSVAVTVPVDTSSGNAASGEQIFWKSCGGCHQINGRGGHLGPDLSRVGSSRPRAALLREIRDASAAIVPGYQAVTIVTSDGQRIRGARKSEDAFSILIMDTRERLLGFEKVNVRELISEPRSLMPDFGADRLSDHDLTDLLRFLGSQRGPDSSRTPGTLDHQ